MGNPVRAGVMVFGVVSADCPWTFKDQLPGPGRGAAKHYDTMTVPELCALPVRDVVDRDAALLLWVPSAVIRDGLAVAHAWGFVEKQTWIWVKTKTGGVEDVEGEIPDIGVDDLSFGMGRYGRNCHEVALFCTRGKVQPLVQVRNIRTVFFSPRLKHSEKPECVQDALDAMFPQLRRLEMFARRKRSPGWLCVGDEAPATLGQDIRITLDDLKARIEARRAA